MHLVVHQGMDRHSVLRAEARQPALAVEQLRPPVCRRLERYRAVAPEVCEIRALQWPVAVIRGEVQDPAIGAADGAGRGVGCVPHLAAVALIGVDDLHGRLGDGLGVNPGAHAQRSQNSSS